MKVSLTRNVGLLLLCLYLFLQGVLLLFGFHDPLPAWAWGLMLIAAALGLMLGI